MLSSESKLRQLAVDLKLVIHGDNITLDALKGKVISHVIKQNLCKPPGRGDMRAAQLRQNEIWQGTLTGWGGGDGRCRHGGGECLAND
jgi:hypothetical protein